MICRTQAICHQCHLEITGTRLKDAFDSRLTGTKRKAAAVDDDEDDDEDDDDDDDEDEDDDEEDEDDDDDDDGDEDEDEDEDEDDDEGWDVEKITKKGHSADGTVVYRVRWLGYSASADTWQTADDLEGARESIDLFESKLSKKAVVAVVPESEYVSLGE